MSLRPFDRVFGNTMPGNEGSRTDAINAVNAVQALGAKAAVTAVAVSAVNTGSADPLVLAALLASNLLSTGAAVNALITETEGGIRGSDRSTVASLGACLVIAGAAFCHASVEQTWWAMIALLGPLSALDVRDLSLGAGRLIRRLISSPA